jgi:hypothetical protein
MKIKLKNNFAAVLQEQSGEVVAMLTATHDARSKMERAVSEHFDCDCSLVTDRDFEYPFDYNQDYSFRFYKAEQDEDEYITLTMTLTPIY